MASRLSGWWNGRRIALTIARRTMRRNLLQSVLIVAIIAIPVAAASAGVIYLESRNATPLEKANMSLGKTQARFTADVPPGKDIYQRPDQGTAFIYKDGAEVPPDARELVNPTTLFPEGHWIIARSDSVLAKTKTGIGNLQLIEGDVWDRAMAGRYDLISGRGPTSDGEVLLTQAAIERTGAKTGASLSFSVGNQFKRFMVVGVMRVSDFADNVSAVFARTGAISGVSPTVNPAGFSFYLAQSEPVTWSQILKFNQSGIGVLSRQVILNPPDPSEVPFNQVNAVFENYNPAGSFFLGALMLVPVILLPVFVLAGSAFAFGARRQQRTLAVLSSLGASKRLLRFLTIANGIWLGLLGGALGLLLGMPLAAVTLSLTSQGSKALYPGFHVSPLYEAAILVGGALVGAVVSAIPAITAAKVDVLNTLRGTRLQAQVKVRTGLFSLLVVAVGAFIVIFAYITTSTYLQELAKHPNSYSQLRETIRVWAAPVGSIVIVLGLILGSGWLLKLLRGVLGIFGLAARFASNDLIYNRRRYQSVIAAVIATSFVGAGVLGLAFSIGQSNNEAYQPSMPKNQIMTDIGWQVGSTTSAQDPAVYEKALKVASNDLGKQLATASSIAEVGSQAIVDRYQPLYKLGFGITPETGQVTLGLEGDTPVIRADPDFLCPQTPGSSSYQLFLKSMHGGSSKDQKRLDALASDPRLQRCDNLTNARDTLMIGGVAELETVLARPASEAAKQALENGGAVGLVPGLTRSGKLTIDWMPSGWSQNVAFASEEAQKSLIEQQPSRSVTLNAVDETVPGWSVTAMISPETAARLGIKHLPSLMFVNYANDLTQSQKDQLFAELGSVQFDRGYPADPQSAAWWILAAVGFLVIASTAIALGLAQIEATADRSTLVAVGAPRRFRARVLGLQALMLTLIGTLFGAGVGFFMAYYMLNLTSSREMHFAIAPVQYSLLIFGIPLVTALGFWIGTPRTERFRARLSLD